MEFDAVLMLIKSNFLFQMLALLCRKNWQNVLEWLCLDDSAVVLIFLLSVSSFQ